MRTRILVWNCFGIDYRSLDVLTASLISKKNKELSSKESWFTKFQKELYII